MSGSGQKDDESKFAALLARLREAEREAAQQCEFAVFQRDRLAGDCRRLTQSPTPARREADDGSSQAEETSASAIVAFAASVGGLAPLMTALDALPLDFQAAVVVAVHTGCGSMLPDLLKRRCLLRVKFAENNELIQSGIVYVAPPVQHLIVNANRTFSVVKGDRLRFARPSADWLFTTMAASYAECAIANVLSGYQRDGARGIIRVKASGGVTIVQDPDTAEANEMPNAAIATGAASRILRPELIAHAIMDRIQDLDLERIRRDFDNPFAATA